MTRLERYMKEAEELKIFPSNYHDIYKDKDTGVCLLSWSSLWPEPGTKCVDIFFIRSNLATLNTPLVKFGEVISISDNLNKWEMDESFQSFNKNR